MKKYLVATLAAVLMTGSITVMAGTVKQSIDAYYSIKSLVVNGNNTGKGQTAFISGGTTYVPLRTVSDAIGANISFDKNTKTIFIETNNSSSDAGMPQDLPAVAQRPAPPVAQRPAPPVAQRPAGHHQMGYNQTEYNQTRYNQGGHHQTGYNGC